MAIVLAAVICVTALVALGGLALYARSRLSEAERARARLASIIDTAPAAAFVWQGEDTEIAFGAIPGMTGTAASPFAEFLAGLDPEAAGRISAATEELCASGTAFSDTVALGDRRVFSLAG